MRLMSDCISIHRKILMRYEINTIRSDNKKKIEMKK